MTVPAGTAADSLLNRLLLPRLADAKWGDEGYYHMRALLDPEVAAALESLPRATNLTQR